MAERVLFEEKQYFRHWGLWLSMLGLFTLSIYSMVSEWKDNALAEPGEKWGAAILLLLWPAITLLFFSIRLETRITTSGVSVRFSPFHRSFRNYSWETIARAYVRKYNPILEYGGWGIRFGIFGKGKALSVFGTRGLQLEFTDQQRLLIGTREPDAIADAVRRIEQYRE